VQNVLFLEALDVHANALVFDALSPYKNHIHTTEESEACFSFTFPLLPSFVMNSCGGMRIYIMSGPLPRIEN
jgi:hypothetical protein